MKADRNPTASKCRQMIGKFIADWRRDKCRDYVLDGILLTEALNMLRFARKINAIDSQADSVLYHYVHSIVRESQ